ncbi:DUF5916 domain-containing protein [Cognatiluteimonas telluris]|uniref:DUF5916 domain-containing protein n=1 Tax=Cognatiluteimonas telluris TaxID=1104775 RepID=UPI00140852CD|nr:DUF5916 domain-containing protein [Lysobacter telluris]
MRRLLLLALIGAALAPPARAQDTHPVDASRVVIDGRIDPAEWAGARHVTDFRLTVPASKAPAPYPTEGWILATPEGLAIAMHNTQPASVPRTRQVAQRDAGAQADRVNLYVDFDGDGRTGYNFTVLLSDSIIDATITNQNQFSTDWDGNWRHAVSDDAEGWSVELLIPWNAAPMRAGKGGKRTIGVSIDRVVGVTGERMSWPAVPFAEPRFLSVLAPIEIPAYSQSLLAITPFAVGVFDNIRGRSDFDTGADVFWKPNGGFQLSATLNPDFGQVESDQLVVNFSAVETFFSDKRPFFTENQGFFDVPFGSLGADRLIYTRRVGGPADDGSGAGDVTAAVKLNGSAAGINYGLFAATEADEVGRDFYAMRATRDFDSQGIGAMVTRVDRPFLDREATVYEFDHRWNPNPRLGIRTTVVGSDIQPQGQATRDTGVQVLVDQDLGNQWRQQLYAEHLGDGLQLNDFGYLQRNNYNYLRYQFAHRETGLPAASRYAAHDWRYTFAARRNDHGVRLSDAAQAEVASDLRNGGNDFMQLAYFSAGHDDLVTRGNGVVDVPGKLYGFYERFTPRKGRWSRYWHLRYAAEGLDGPAHGSIELDFEPTYFVNDNLSFSAGLLALHNPDWLLQPPTVDAPGNLLASYRANQLSLNGGVQWIISPKQELRVKLETIALDARVRQAWRVAPDGAAVASDEPVSDFSLRNLGFQIRYRYELAPLSNLYIAYVRGGAGTQAYAQQVGPLLGDAFSLRDSEQLLVKLSYRFEL